jgi:hypothetical protein
MGFPNEIFTSVLRSSLGRLRPDKEQIRCPKEPGANVGLPFLAQNWVVACEAQPDRSHLAGRFVTSLSLWAGLI